MRKFKILKWPKVAIQKQDLSKPYPLVKEFEKSKCVLLNVNGIELYFYPNEVEEVTNE